MSTQDAQKQWLTFPISTQITSKLPFFEGRKGEVRIQVGALRKSYRKPPVLALQIYHLDTVFDKPSMQDTEKREILVNIVMRGLPAVYTWRLSRSDTQRILDHSVLAGNREMPWHQSLQWIRNGLPPMEVGNLFLGWREYSLPNQSLFDAHCSMRCMLVQRKETLTLCKLCLIASYKPSQWLELAAMQRTNQGRPYLYSSSAELEREKLLLLFDSFFEWGQDRSWGKDLDAFRKAIWLPEHRERK